MNIQCYTCPANAEIKFRCNPNHIFCLNCLKAIDSLFTCPIGCQTRNGRIPDILDVGGSYFNYSVDFKPAQDSIQTKRLVLKNSLSLCKIWDQIKFDGREIQAREKIIDFDSIIDQTEIGYENIIKFRIKFKNQVTDLQELVAEYEEKFDTDVYSYDVKGSNLFSYSVDFKPELDLKDKLKALKNSKIFTDSWNKVAFDGTKLWMEKEVTEGCGTIKDEYVIQDGKSGRFRMKYIKKHDKNDSQAQANFKTFKQSYQKRYNKNYYDTKVDLEWGEEVNIREKYRQFLKNTGRNELLNQLLLDRPRFVRYMNYFYANEYDLGKLGWAWSRDYGENELAEREDPIKNKERYQEKSIILNIKKSRPVIPSKYTFTNNSRPQTSLLRPWLLTEQNIANKNRVVHMVVGNKKLNNIIYGQIRLEEENPTLFYKNLNERTLETQSEFEKRLFGAPEIKLTVEEQKAKCREALDRMNKSKINFVKQGAVVPNYRTKPKSSAYYNNLPRTFAEVEKMDIDFRAENIVELFGGFDFSGRAMKLMMKMGFKKGDKLGLNKNGILEPIKSTYGHARSFAQPYVPNTVELEFEDYAKKLEVFGSLDIRYRKEIIRPQPTAPTVLENLVFEISKLEGPVWQDLSKIKVFKESFGKILTLNWKVCGEICEEDNLKLNTARLLHRGDFTGRLAARAIVGNMVPKIFCGKDKGRQMEYIREKFAKELKKGTRSTRINFTLPGKVPAEIYIFSHSATKLCSFMCLFDKILKMSKGISEKGLVFYDVLKKKELDALFGSNMMSMCRYACEGNIFKFLFFIPASIKE